MLSIIYNIKQNEHWLRGHRFKLHTDSKALEQVFNGGNDLKQNSTISAWIAELSEFNFDVYHISGKNNELPDLLSRMNSNASCNATDSHWNDESIKELLSKAHNVLSHLGSSAMYHLIKDTWQILDIPNLKRKCVEFCSQCFECLKVNRGRIPFAPAREPELWHGMEYMHIDLLHMSKSDSDFEYLLVAIDSMTRFVWLRPIESKSADSIVEALISIFCEFGFPGRIKTDNGSEFLNSAIDKLLKVAQVSHFQTVAYNHHANGLVERQNKTVREMVVKTANALNKLSCWNEVVPAVQFSMNARHHSELHTSPFALMFGRNPFQFEIQEPTNCSTDSSKLKEFWEHFHQVVPSNVVTILKRKVSTRPYRHVIDTSLGEGDIVFTEVNPRPSKMDPAFDGPYRITEVRDKGHFKLDDERIMPRNMLKKASKSLSSQVTFDSNKVGNKHQTSANDLTSYQVEKGDYFYDFGNKTKSKSMNNVQVKKAQRSSARLSDGKVKSVFYKR